MATVGSVVFHGLSTDPRPTVEPRTSGDLPVPCFFVCDDTGETFLWNGAFWLSLASSSLTASPTAAVEAATLVATLAVASRLDMTNQLLRKLIAGLELNLQNGEFPDVE